MQINFSYNTSDERQIFKVLSGGSSLSGSLKEMSSIINPVITVESSSVLRYNFCYIPEWQRYFFVRDITSDRTGLYTVHLECDVLMSFKNDIAMFQVIVDKQSDADNGDEYIDDNSLVCDNIMFTRVYKYPQGFNSSPTYILITAG